MTVGERDELVRDLERAGVYVESEGPESHRYTIQANARFGPGAQTRRTSTSSRTPRASGKPYKMG